MMKLGEALRLKHRPVVRGVFHNTDELFRAYTVLTDYGYPKESARMSGVETILPVDDAGVFGLSARYLTTKRIIIALAVMAVVTIGGVALAEMPLSAYGRLPEVVVTLALWALFFSVGSLACALIGFLLWALLQPLAFNQNYGRGNRLMGAGINTKVTLRVKTRTNVDAEEIAQAWADIGGRVIEPGKIAPSEGTPTQPLSV